MLFYLSVYISLSSPLALSLSCLRVRAYRQMVTYSLNIRFYNIKYQTISKCHDRHRSILDTYKLRCYRRGLRIRDTKIITRMSIYVIFISVDSVDTIYYNGYTYCLYLFHFHHIAPTFYRLFYFSLLTSYFFSLLLFLIHISQSHISVVYLSLSLFSASFSLSLFCIHIKYYQIINSFCKCIFYILSL